jgi:undecaprenyl-diphosphatase
MTAAFHKGGDVGAPSGDAGTCRLANRNRVIVLPFIQLIVLAIIQGVTEFLPISSSAHLILAPLVVNGWRDQGPLIDIAAHVGSLVAVFIYFRTETAMLFRGGIDAVMFRASDDRKLFLFIAGATVPIVIAGAMLFLLGLTEAFRSATAIGAASIVFGVILWHSDRAPAKIEGLSGITWRGALTIGAAQILALIPGASRAGVTISAARYLGWTRTEAARFSMLLAIPTISAFGLIAGIELLREGARATLAAAAIVGVLSLVTAFLTIAVFMKLTRRISFTPFVVYRILFGLAALIFAGSLNAG